MTQASISLPNKIKLDRAYVFHFFSSTSLFIFLALLWLLLLFFCLEPPGPASQLPGSNLQLSVESLQVRTSDHPASASLAEEKMTHQLTGEGSLFSGLEEPVRTNEWCGKSRCPREYSLVALTSLKG